MTVRDLEREQANKELIKTAFADWAAGTGGPFALLADDATWTVVGNSPVSRTFPSKKEFIDVVIDPFNARLSAPLVPTVRALFADGDWVIALFDGEATAADGRPYRNTYTWYLQLQEGTVVEVIAFFDTIEFTDFWQRLGPA
jgi:ketosteroid isomerase-like protein